MESECIEIWVSLFSGPLSFVLQSTSTLAAVACDCVANIGSNIYELLPVSVYLILMY